MVPGDYITGQKATYFEHDFSFTVKREDFFQCRIYATCSKVCSIIFFFDICSNHYQLYIQI